MTIEASILIEGLPGVGHVGKLVADHLIDALWGELIAEIYSLHFPSQVIVDEGVAHLVGNEIYRCEKDGRRSFLVDFQSIGGGTLYPDGELPGYRRRSGCPADLRSRVRRWSSGRESADLFCCQYGASPI